MRLLRRAFDADVPDARHLLRQPVTGAGTRRPGDARRASEIGWVRDPAERSRSRCRPGRGSSGTTTRSRRPPAPCVLAESAGGPQAYTLGRSLAVQFHPEVTPEIVDRLARRRARSARPRTGWRPVAIESWHDDAAEPGRWRGDAVLDGVPGSAPAATRLVDCESAGARGLADLEPAAAPRAPPRGRRRSRPRPDAARSPEPHDALERRSGALEHGLDGAVGCGCVIQPGRRGRRPAGGPSRGRTRPARGRERSPAGVSDRLATATILAGKRLLAVAGRSVRAPRHAGAAHGCPVVTDRICSPAPAPCSSRVRPRLRALSGEAARAVELERELVRARADLEHERALAARAAGDDQRRPGAAVGIVQGAERRGAAGRAWRSCPSSPARSCSAARPRPRATWTSASRPSSSWWRRCKEQLGRVDAQLLALDQERRESRGRLEAQLRTLAETGERLRTETGALVTALRKPNARGQWGQMQLRNVVELAGMVRYCDFVEQSAGGRRRVDAAAGPGRQPAGRQARRRRRQGAAPGRARRLPGARRGGAPAAPARSRPAAPPPRQGAGRQGLLGRARLGARPRRDVPAGRASVRRRARGRPGADRGRDGAAGADRHADDAAGDAARGRLRLAAGARRRVRPGDLRARPRAARPAASSSRPCWPRSARG